MYYIYIILYNIINYMMEIYMIGYIYMIEIHCKER